MYDISIKDMFKSCIHYGHNKSKLNPKMKKFILCTYNKISIIDLDKSIVLFEKALKNIKNIINNNGKILFVGTKKIIKEKIKITAIKTNQYFINNRWLGGTLTNWNTVKKSIKKFKNLYTNYNNNNKNNLTKKENLLYSRNIKKMKKNLIGILNMNRLPNALFIIDANNEKIAIKESNKLNIPIFSIVDTDSDPSNINFVIPGNDDSNKSINFFLDHVTNIIMNKNI